MADEPKDDAQKSQFKAWLKEALDEREAEFEAKRKADEEAANAAKPKGIMNTLFGG